MRKRPLCVRPTLQALEDRLLPSFTVNNLLDDGSVGSLRWAVNQVNSTGGSQTINFDSTVFNTPQTIYLTGTQLELTDTTGTETITGPAVGVTVNGGYLSRVFKIDRLVKASISGLTISGGENFSGGGLINGGTTTLTNCTITGNNAYVFNYNFDPAGGGGGISNHGTLSLINCSVSNNSSSCGGFYGFSEGGGINNYGGTLSLTNCTVSGNSSGIIDRFSGLGGGIANAGLGTVSLTNCTISGNYAAAFGSGGGLYNGGSSTSTLTNCTVSGNSVTGEFNSAGGGVSTGAAAATTLNNTLVAGNNSVTNDSDVSGACTNTSGFNLIGNGTGLTGISNGVNGNQIGTAANPINPLLAALGNYGGPTQTMALLPDSPALDAGSNALAVNSQGKPLIFDQRGFARIVNGTVDIGAFESSGFSLSGAGGNFQGVQVGQGFPNALTGQVHSKFNEPVAGGVVTFSAPATGASALLAPTQATIDSTGLASTLATANTSAGKYIVTASVNPHSSPLKFYLSNLSGPATQLQILSTHGAKVNTPFSFEVLARDVYGNLATSYSGTVAFNCSDPMAVLPGPYTFQSSDQGAHVFSATLNTVGSQTITATDTNASSITGQSAITVHGGLAPDSASVSGIAAGLEASLMRYDFFLQQRLDPAGLYVGGR
jgi:hypothetical protein